MLFDKVIIKNFQSFGDEEQTISLDTKDITLITGFNEITGSSNGSGKSVLISAVLWCLYGKTRDSADNVVNKYTGKQNCKVEMIFYKNNIKYDVIRYRAHQEQKNKLYLFQDDKDVSYDDARDTQDLINKVLAVSYDSFVSALVFGNIYSNFMNSTNVKRLEIIENILDITQINTYFEKIKAMIKKIEEKESELNIKRVAFESQLKTTEKTIEDYKTTIATKYKTITSKIKSLELTKQEYASISNIDEMIKGLKDREINKLAIADINSNLSVLKLTNEDKFILRLSDYENKINNIEDSIKYNEEHSDKCPTCGQDVNKSVTLKEIAKLNLELISLTNDKKSLFEEFEKSTKENKEIQVRINKLTVDKKEFEKNLNSIPEINYTEKELLEISNRIESIDIELSSLNTSLQTIADKDFVKSKLVEIEEFKDSIEKNSKLISKTVEEKSYFKYFYDLFGNKTDGLKRFIVNKILPILNEKINEYLTYYFTNSNVVVEFNDGLKESITVDGEKYAIKELSTGEQRRIEIACIFALFFMVKAYLGMTSNLLILDEVLDIGLDDSGIQSTINILEKLKDEGNSIFIISHRTSFKDYFDTRLKIVKNKKHISRIESELS